MSDHRVFNEGVVFFYWFLLAILGARVTLFNRVRDAASYSSLDASAIVELVAVVSLAIFLFFDSNIKVGIRELCKSPLAVLVLYYFLSLVSSIWSINSYFTLYRAFQAIVIVLVVNQITIFASKLDIDKRVVGFLSVLTCFYILQIFIKSGLSVTINDFHTNDYTVISGLGLIYVFFVNINNEKKYPKNLFFNRYFYFFAFTFFIGTSSASYFSLSIVILIFFMTFLNKYLSVSIAMILVVFVFVFGIVDLNFLFSMIFPDKNLTEIYTLRGRVDLWSVYWRMFLDHPFAGNGFAVASRVAEYYGGRGATNAHNGFFEALLGTGIFGFFLFIAFFLKAFSWSKHTYNKYGKILFYGLIFVIINNNSKSIIGGSVDPTTIATLLVLASCFNCGDMAFKCKKSFLIGVYGDK